MTWKDELRNIPAADAPKDLLECILASRAAGVRVVLPQDRSTVSRRAALLFLTAAAAAVVLVMRARSGDQRPVGTENEFPDITAGLSLWPPDAGGQGTGPPPRPRHQPGRNLPVAPAPGGKGAYRARTACAHGPTHLPRRLPHTRADG